MNYLLTGAGGFIGGNLLKYIKRNKLLKEEDRLFVLSKKGISPSFGIIPIKINNYCLDPDFFRNNNIDCIDVLILLGGYTPKSSSVIDFDKTLEGIKNIQSILNAMPNSYYKIIFSSTLDVYGNTNTIISEDSVISPISLYGASKFFLEKFVQEWTEYKNITHQILRLGHIYGPGEEAYHKLIPVSIKKLIKGEVPVIYSDGSDLRSFLHVNDCCRIIWNSIFLEESAGPINVVSSIPESIKKIVEILCQFSSPEITPVILNKPVPVRNLIFDNSKMKKNLGEEKITLKDGLFQEWEYFLSLKEIIT